VILQYFVNVLYQFLAAFFVGAESAPARFAIVRRIETKIACAYPLVDGRDYARSQGEITNIVASGTVTVPS